MSKRKGEVDYEQFYLRNYDKNYKKKFDRRKFNSEHIEIVSVPVIGDVKIKTDDAIVTYPETAVKKSESADGYEIIGIENGKINYTGSVSDILSEKKNNRVIAIKSAETDGKPNTKQRKKPKIFRSFLIVIFLIIMCFCATLLSCDYLTGGAVMKAVTYAALYSQKDYYRVYYGVKMYEFENRADAQTACDEVRIKNGAGYIVEENGKYCVLGGVYKTEEDAKSIIKNLENDGFSGSQVYVIPIKNIAVSLFPQEVQLEAESAFKYFFAAADKLYEISNELDKGLTDEDTVKANINNILKNLRVLEENFNSKSALYETNVEVIRFKAQLNAVSASVENILNTVISRPNLLCDIRYTVALITVTTRVYAETKSK